MSLDIELVDTDVLCERHFHEEDIIRNDEVTLANGDKYISPRQILKLSPNAIPSRFPDNNQEVFQINSDKVSAQNLETNADKDYQNVTITNELTDDDNIILNTPDESIIERKEPESSLADEISCKADEKLSSLHEQVDDISESTDVSLNIMREKIPAEWHVNKYSNVIILSHINPITFEIKKQIKILPDMTMQVI